MQLLTGMYNARIDDKGRLSLPARLRNALATEQVVVLPGLDENHLMIMRPEYFEKDFSEPILSSPMAMLDKKNRILTVSLSESSFLLLSMLISMVLEESIFQRRYAISTAFRISRKLFLSEQDIQ